MNRTKIIVDELLDLIRKRERKVQSNIQELQKEADTIRNDIRNLTSQLVNYEINDDLAGQKEANKKLAGLKSQLDSIEAKIAAYKNTPDCSGIVRVELPRLFAAARQDEEERGKILQKNQERRAELENEIKQIQDRINSIIQESDKLYGPVEATQLRPLLKYIQPSRLKFGCEDLYLQALMSGDPDEILNQYIEEAPVPIGPKSACIRTQYHPSTAEDEAALEGARRAQVYAK